MKILKAKELEENKVTALIYGNPGMGKTTLLGMLPGKSLIIDVDRGTRVLQGNDTVDILRVSEDLSEMPKVLKELQEKCDYQNVCIDSLSELERGLLAYYGRLGKNDGIPGVQDYGRVNFKLVDLCRQFRALPCNVFFTAWEEQGEIIANTGEKYTQARPLLRDKIVDNICGLCDIVGRIVMNPKDNERYVLLESGANAIAKDRINKRKYCKFDEVLV